MPQFGRYVYLGKHVWRQFCFLCFSVNRKQMVRASSPNLAIIQSVQFVPVTLNFNAIQKKCVLFIRGKQKS